jgi:hypothetical protein
MVLYDFDAILVLVQLLHVRALILIRPDIDVDDLDMLVDHLVSQRRHASNEPYTHTYTRARALGSISYTQQSVSRSVPQWPALRAERRVKEFCVKTYVPKEVLQQCMPIPVQC